MSTTVAHLLDLLDRHLQSIWTGDIETYRQTTAADVSFFEWYISPQRIDGLDFHLRELAVHAQTLAGVAGGRIEHEVLQPRVQFYGDTAILTYTLLIRSIHPGGVSHKTHHETRVFHDFGAGGAPAWQLVHCHKSPVATADSLDVLRR